VADEALHVTVVAEDRVGDPVVGILRIGEHTEKMDHAGAFSARLDVSAWPAGLHTVRAVLCNRWSSVSYELGAILIEH
jgi:hypothetical protein